MADLTIGQRIAQQRKNLNFSQEALGEKVGVSRQAISKWEADASVPEIDKLIALSKLFGVSVGWLLGLEEEQTEPAEQPKAAEPSFWQTLLAHLKTLPGLKQLGILLLVLVQLFLYWQLLWCYNTAKRAEMYASMAEHTTDRLELDIKALQEQLTQQQEIAPGTLLSVYNFDTVEPDGSPKATISFSAVPYSWQEGDIGTLYVQGKGIPTMQIPCQWDGAFLTCFLQLELRSGLEFCFSVEHADGSRQLQGLFDDYLQNTDFAEAPLITGGLKDARYDPEKKAVFVQQLEVNFSRSERHIESGVTWQTWAVLLLCDGEEIARHTIFEANIQNDSTRTGGGGGIESTLMELPLIENVVLSEGQTVELVAYADFSSGISSQELLMRWQVGTDGELVPVTEE